MNIQGKVEITSKEGELGAPQGYRWIKLADMDILVSIAMTVKVGEQLSVEAINTNLGLRAQKIEKIFSPEEGDYLSLVTDCKGIVERAKKTAEEFLRANWELGKRVTNVETTYGEGTIKRLAKDIEVSPQHLYNCIKFVEKYPQFEQEKKRFSNALENSPWREIVKGLYEPRKPTSLPTALPSNAPATPEELHRAYAPERAPLPRSESKPALQFREILTWNHYSHTSEKEFNVTTERGPRTYIADFFVNHTILEVDSPLHNPDDDEQRDKDLLTLGFKTERFLDTDIAITHKTLSRLREIVAVEQVPVY